jgi:hypothetical protein
MDDRPAMHSPIVTRLAPRPASNKWPVYPAVIVFAMLALAGIVTMQLSYDMPEPLSDVLFIAGLWFAVSGTLGSAIWAVFGRSIFRD